MHSPALEQYLKTQSCYSDWVFYFYVIICTATIWLWLRRTLVLQEFYSTFTNITITYIYCLIL